MANLDPSASIPLAVARYHGDQAAEPGMLDFAVNVRHAQPPAWLVQRLAARVPDLARYPGADDERTAIQAVAVRHGRAPDEVALLAGAAEGFALLPNLRPTLAAVIAPSFTEPAVALRAAGVRVRHVVLDRPFSLAGAQVPDDADLVVVGNPTNPTSVLHTREQILALRRPGRIVVVDEAFADSVPGEPESLADEPLPDVLVVSQSDQDVVAGWPAGRLRAGCARRVGAADGSTAALAGGHAATDGHRGLLCTRRRGRSGSGSSTSGGVAHRDGVWPAVGGCRASRWPCAIRLVHR